MAVEERATMSSDVLVAGETIARAIAEGLSTIARAQEEG